MNDATETLEQVETDDIAENSEGLPLVRLDEIGENTIIDEANLAKLFGRCRKSVKRSVARGELPMPVRLFGQDAWLAGQLAAHMKARLESAARDRMRLVRK